MPAARTCDDTNLEAISIACSKIVRSPYANHPVSHFDDRSQIPAYLGGRVMVLLFEDELGQGDGVGLASFGLHLCNLEIGFMFLSAVYESVREM